MSLSKAQKLAALKEADANLTKKYKQTAFQRRADEVHERVPSLPTNLPTLDYEVLGCGGWPKGRVIEVYGPESSGKTAICLHTIAQVQKAGGVAAFIDAEHALSPQFAATLGVNIEELVVSQPDYGEQALEIAEELVEKQAVDLIVIDSVTALVPKAELEGDMGDSHMGLQARLMSQAMRKLVGLCAKKGVTIVFINQVREKVGLVFGNPEVTTGGRALKFFASMRVEVRRVSGAEGLIKDGTEIIGHKLKVKAQKNKLASPFKESVVELIYDKGFDTAEDLVKFAKKIGIVEGGAWLTVKGVEGKFRSEDLPILTIGKLVNSYIDEQWAQKQLEFEEEA